ncbi:MAG: hypothetical protein JO348_09570 [Alphaproteobacteria bacterium]|nr:hypothetical protein [Alphaproteobacteria bacterium]
MRGRHSMLVAIMLGGAIAGIVDIFAASAINGFIDPLRICRVIAAGVLGLKEARAGGMQTAALGLVLQVAMGIIIAAIYNIAANILPIMRRRWLLSGFLFGFPVFAVMTYVVVPLSAVGGGMPPFKVKQAMNLVAMFLFGIIIAWFARAKRTA